MYRPRRGQMIRLKPDFASLSGRQKTEGGEVPLGTKVTRHGSGVVKTMAGQVSRIDPPVAALRRGICWLAFRAHKKTAAELHPSATA
jgi:hypothetical protein